MAKCLPFRHYVKSFWEASVQTIRAYGRDDPFFWSSLKNGRKNGHLRM